MKNLTKTLLAIYIAIMCVAVACKKDEPTPTTTTPPVVTTKSSAKDIIKFSFATLSPVVEATIDASTKAITATVPAGTDVTKLVPTITISDKSTVSPASGVAQDFSKEVSYTVTAEDGSTAVWKVGVKVVVAQSCQLIGIIVNNDNGTLNETFEYDTEKRLIKRTSKSKSIDTKIDYSYDNDGFLTQIVWQRMNASSAYDNIKRVSSYTYKNGRLILQDIKQTTGTGTVSTGSSTYEYESETSDKLKKVVYMDVVTGNATPYTFLFTNGVLSSYTDPYKNNNIINAMGLVTQSLTTDGKFNQEYNYDVNGQPIKYGYVPADIEKTYTTIKNKYDQFDLITRGQDYPSIFWLAQDAETVFNPKGFKGFPNFKIYFSLYDKGTYLIKTYKSGTDVRTYDYKTDANGNVTSYTITYASGTPTTGTLTYKCN